MSKEELDLSWLGVRRYAQQAIRRSWIVLFSGTVSIAILAILIPWGFVYGFSESGWDQVMGGNAVWSLLAIPAWLLILGVWYLARAPMGHAQEVVAAYAQRLDDTQQNLLAIQYELERERAAAPIFGDAVVPHRIVGRLIRLNDLPPGLWLDENVIEESELTGPAKILVAGGRYTGCRFYGFSNSTFVATDTPEKHFGDAIVFRECQVSGCKFHNVTILGSADTIRNLRVGMAEEGT